MQNKIWLTVIFGGWMTVAASSILDMQRGIAPASDWLEVKKLHVYDAWKGEQPYMHVNRFIKQPFYSEWTVTVRNVSDGTLSHACIAEGRASYATDARLPPDTNLAWWTFPTKCPLDVGWYRLDTEWRIHAPNFPMKYLRKQSNIFEIHEATWR